jgi:SagB-type dehydrogenase family enzyme
VRVLVGIILVGLVGSCGGERAGIDMSRSEQRRVIEQVDLPPPVRSGGAPLTDALSERRSIREYSGEQVDLDAISQLLWAAQGITSEEGQRAAPSAGALYPLELYVVMATGLHHFAPAHHQLEVLGRKDLRGALSQAALSQSAVADAPVVFVITGVCARTEEKYGDRAERYVVLEAGHAAQNVLLQATASGLAAVPIGAFHDDDVQHVLGLPPDHEPLYLIPVGHPVP